MTLALVYCSWSGRPIVTQSLESRCKGHVKKVSMCSRSGAEGIRPLTEQAIVKRPKHIKGKVKKTTTTAFCSRRLNQSAGVVAG